jgi:hypothetical protein
MVEYLTAIEAVLNSQDPSASLTAAHVDHVSILTNLRERCSFDVSRQVEGCLQKILDRAELSLLVADLGGLEMDEMNRLGALMKELME